MKYIYFYYLINPYNKHVRKDYWPYFTDEKIEAHKTHCVLYLGRRVSFIKLEAEIDQHP